MMLKERRAMRQQVKKKSLLKLLVDIYLTTYTRLCQIDAQQIKSTWQ